MLGHFIYGTIAACCRWTGTEGLVKAAVVGMPLGRYFVFTGSMLLALLFLADWYMPHTAAPTARAEFDRSIIRLRSQHKGPERIAIDTSLPTIVPPPVDIVEPPPVKATVTARAPSDAFAMAPPAQAIAPATASKPLPKRRARTARTGGHPASFEAIGFRQALPPGW
jgi:hypothetical protein